MFYCVVVVHSPNAFSHLQTNPYCEVYRGSLERRPPQPDSRFISGIKSVLADGICADGIFYFGSVYPSSKQLPLQ